MSIPRNDPAWGIAVRYAIKGARKDLLILIEYENGSHYWLRSYRQVGKDFDEYVFVDKEGPVVLDFEES